MKFAEYKELLTGISLDDFGSLLNIGRKWKKIEGQDYNAKIAFIGSASIQLTTSVTRALLTRYDIYAEVYEGEYNGIMLDAMDVNSNMYRFAPDYIVMIPDYHDIEDYRPDVLANADEIDKNVATVVDYYIKIFDSIHTQLPAAQIFCANMVSPFWSSLGNLGANYLFSKENFYKLVNLSLVKKKPSFVTMLDMDGLACYIGKNSWFDESAYCLNKSGFSLTNIGYVCDLIARQFEAIKGKVKKCIVLDLDNTLWGGVVGDVGCMGINIDPNDAEGEAFLAFQEYLLEMKRRGVLLAVCSKNDEENAKEPFEKNHNMRIKLDDVSCFVANWNDKASNIKVIAQELNIGIDSIVFFDDNPTERALVRDFLPDVTVVEVPSDPALYVRALDRANVFDWIQLTEEDVNRVKTYVDNRKRNTLLDSCVNYDEYLRKLEMTIKMEEVNELSIERFVQLTNKSNQFNLRTQRYSEAEIDDMLHNLDYKLFTVSLADRFSNYGIIACVVLKFQDVTCIIENWVMSCRVLKKSVENYTIERIVDLAKKSEAREIRAEYLKSKTNNMVSDLYDVLGFEKVDSNDEQAHFVLRGDALKNYKQKYYFKEEN